MKFRAWETASDRAKRADDKWGAGPALRNQKPQTGERETPMIDRAHALETAECLMWYVANRPVEKIYLEIYGPGRDAPLSADDSHFVEGIARIRRRNFGEIFGHLDANNRARMVDAALKAYDR